MRKITLSREDGFTLLEVVFAVSILAIGIMGYTALKVSNRYSWMFSKNLTLAVQMSDSNLEGLRMAGYNDTGWLTAGTHKVTVNGDGSHTLSNAENDAGEEPEVAAGDFEASSVSWSVREGCPTAMTKMVNYTTNWNLGGDKNVTLTQVQVRP